MKKDCYGRKKQINNENNKQVHTATTKPGFAFMLKSVNQYNNNLNLNLNFILDSGATDHLINNESLFVDYADLETPIKIAVAKRGEYIFATKRGVVRLENEYQITLEDVLYCGEVVENLISVKRLQEAGVTVMFDEKGVKLTKSGKTIAENSGAYNVPVIEFKAYKVDTENKDFVNI